MSRVLDSDCAPSVLASNPQAAYKNIVNALNMNTSELLDIEVLGKSHPVPLGCSVLLDGHSIGISKPQLIQAFVVARKTFFETLENFEEDMFQDIRDATAVILLMDPEHITAANARKRILQYCQAVVGIELRSMLSREFLLIDSFLTSRLHRHTKSPTLWGHRQWLVQILVSVDFTHSIQQDVETVVLIAAERHPRNYYAWLHLRWLLLGLRRLAHDTGGSSALSHTEVLLLVKDWCLRHLADTSGWSFLLFFLLSIEPPSTRLETSSSICQEVLGLATTFQWTHESIWVFLRTLVASGEIQQDQRLSFFKTVEVVLDAQPADSKARNILKASQDWCIDHSL